MPDPITKAPLKGRRMTDDERRELANLAGWTASQASQIGMGRIAPSVDIENFKTPKPYSDNDPMSNWGSSRYDDEFVNQPLTEGQIQDMRYENQSSWDVISNGQMKMLGTAGTTFLSSLIGLPVGLITAISEGRWSGLWDNKVTEMLGDVDNWFEDNFKNYKSTEQQQANWWETSNLFSMNFIADDIIKNAGFTLGAAASAMTFTGGLGLLGRAMGMMKEATSAPFAIKALGALFSATGEGMIEARNGVEERNKQEIEKFKNELAPEYQALEEEEGQILAEYEENRDAVAYDPATGQYYNPAKIKYQKRLRELQAKRQELDNKKQAGLERIEETGKQMGNKILLLNQALLTLNNLSMFGRGMSKSFENAYHVAESTKKLTRGVGEGLMRQTADRTGRGAASKLVMPNKRVGQVYAATKGFFREGSEEMNQQWIQSGAGEAYNEQDVNDYWRYRLNHDAYRATTEGLYNFGQILDRGWKASWGDPKQWSQFLVGALTGLAGTYMPTKVFNPDKSKAWYNPMRWGEFEGGAYQDVKEYNEQYKLYQQNIDDLNKVMSNENFKTRLLNFIGTTKARMEKDRAAQEGDIKTWKDEDDKEMVLTLQSFYRAGMLDDLVTIADEIGADMTAEDIASVVKATTRIVTTEDQKRELELDKARINSRISDIDRELQELEGKKFKGKSRNKLNKEKEKLQKELQDTETSIAQLDEKIKNAGSETKYIGPYVDEQGNRRKDYKEDDAIKQEMSNNAENLREKINSFLESATAVQEISHGMFTNEQEDNLVYLHQIHRNKLDRFYKIFAKNRKSLPEEYIIKTNKTPEQFTEYYGVSDLSFSKDDNIPEGYVKVDTSKMSDTAFADFVNDFIINGSNITPEYSEDDIKALSEIENEKNKHQEKITGIEEKIKELEKKAEELRSKQKAEPQPQPTPQQPSAPKTSAEKQALVDKMSDLFSQDLDELDSIEKQIKELKKQLKQEQDAIKDLEHKQTTQLKNKNEEAKEKKKEQMNVNHKHMQKKFADNMANTTNLTADEINNMWREVHNDIQDAINLYYESMAFHATLREYRDNIGKVDESKKEAEDDLKKKKDNDDINEMSTRELADRDDLPELLKQAEKDGNVELRNRIKAAMEGRRKKAGLRSAKKSPDINFDLGEKNDIIDTIEKNLDAALDEMGDGTKDLDEMLNIIDSIGERSVDDLIPVMASKEQLAQLGMLEESGDEEAYEVAYRMVADSIGKKLREIDTYAKVNTDDMGEKKRTPDVDTDKMGQKTEPLPDPPSAAGKDPDPVPSTPPVPVEGKPETKEDEIEQGLKEGAVIDDSALKKDKDEGTSGWKTEKSGNKPWRNVTRRVGGNTNEAYSKSLDELLKNKNLDPVLRKKYEKQLKRMQAVEAFLESGENSAFDRIEQGFVTQGMEVRFKVFKSVNDATKVNDEDEGDFVIFMVDSNGNILGDLPSGDTDIEKSTNEIQGLSDLYKEARRQWNELNEQQRGDPNGYTIKGVSSVVNNTYIGKVLYQEKRQSLNSLFTDKKGKREKFHLALKISDKGENSAAVAKIVVSKRRYNSDVNAADIIQPLGANFGQPFVLIPTSNVNRKNGGRKYMCVPISTKPFKELGEDTLFHRVVRDILEKVKANQMNSATAKALLNDLFGVRNVHVNFEGDESKKGPGISFTTYKRINESEKGNPHDIYSGKREDMDIDKILDALGDFRPNISIKYINSKSKKGFYELDGEAVDYNEMIGEIAETNAAETHTVNDFFTLQPLEVRDGKLQMIQKRWNAQRIPYPSTGENTVCTYTFTDDKGASRTWSVDVADGFTCTDEEGNIVDASSKNHTKTEKNQAEKLRAMAWGSFYQRDMTKPYSVVLDGVAKVYNPSKNTFTREKVLEEKYPLYDSKKKFNSALAKASFIDEVIAGMTPEEWDELNNHGKPVKVTDEEIIEGVVEDMEGLGFKTYYNETSAQEYLDKNGKEGIEEGSKVDTNFMVVGEKGLREAMLAEARANSNNYLFYNILKKMTVAKEMQAAGKDRKTIKMATGWEYGIDHRWRYEMLDFYLSKDTIDNKPGKNKTIKLVDIVKDRKYLEGYLKMYPSLENVDVVFEPSSTWWGKFDGNTIHIASNVFLDEDGKVKDVNELQSTMVHEIQHFVQQQEGFSSGGNTDWMKSFISQMYDMLDKEREKRQEAINKYLSEEYAIREKLRRNNDEYRASLETVRKYYSRIDGVTKEDFLKARKRIEEIFASADNRSKDQYEEHEKWLSKMTPVLDALQRVKEYPNSDYAKGVAYKFYKNLLGEIESRIASKRMNMPYAERRKSSFVEDVINEGDMSIKDISNGKVFLSYVDGGFRFLLKDGTTLNLFANTKQMESFSEFLESKETVELEMQAIKEQALKDGTFMKAPNGKDTNLTERQWLQVRTKAFKRWFGDWERVAPKNIKGNLINQNGEINWEYFEQLLNAYHNSQPDSMFAKGRTTLATREEKHFTGEKNTLNHIKFVTQSMLDLFEGKFDADLPFVSEARASLQNQKDLMVLAAMFHDAAKPYRHGDIHGWESADILRDVVGIDYNNRLAEWAIRHHMAMPFSHKAEFNLSNPEAIEVARNMARDAKRIGIDAQTAINAFVLINAADIINGREITVEDNWAKKAKAAGSTKFGDDISVKSVLTTELKEKVDLLKKAFEDIKDEDLGNPEQNYRNQSRFDYASYPEGGRADGRLPYLSNVVDNGVSKVVDENGEPLVVYSGRPVKGVTDFTNTLKSKRSRTNLTNLLDKRVYFTNNYATARQYEGSRTEESPENKFHRYMSMWLNEDSNIDKEWILKNVEYATEERIEEAIQKYYKEVVDPEFGPIGTYYTGPNSGAPSLVPGETIAAFLNIREPFTADLEHNSIAHLTSDQISGINNAEGAILYNVYEDTTKAPVPGVTDYLVSNPNQIKSATDNNGDFSRENDDIQMSAGDVQGTVRGFVTKDDVIYLDKRYATLDTPMHEFTHIWDRIVRNADPRLWDKGKRLMKAAASDLWRRVSESENYGKRWKDQGLSDKEIEDRIASEVHSRLVGERFEELVRSKPNTVWGRLKQWLLDFFKSLAKTFGLSREEIEKLTIEDFKDMTIRDFMEKKTTYQQAENVRKTNAAIEVLRKHNAHYVLCDENGNPDKNGRFYKDKRTGKLYGRVTSAIEGDPNIDPFDESSPWKVPSTAIGNQIDRFVRAFFKGESLGDSAFPNLSEDSRKALTQRLEEMKEEWLKHGWQVIADETKVAGSLIVKDRNGDNMTMRVCGTLDLLAYNPVKDEFMIIDIKSHRGPLEENYEKDPHYPKWQAQTSVYKRMFELPGMVGMGVKVSGLMILPIEVDEESYNANQQSYTLGGNILLDSHGKVVDVKFANKRDCLTITEKMPDINVSKKDFKYSGEALSKIVTGMQRPKVTEAPKQKVKEGIIKMIGNFRTESKASDYLKDEYKNDNEALDLCKDIDNARKDGTLQDLMVPETNLLKLDNMFDESKLEAEVVTDATNGILPKGSVPVNDTKKNVSVDDEARSVGVLTDKLQGIWDMLTDENKRKAVDNPIDAKKVLKNALRKGKNPNDEFEGFHRKAVEEKVSRKIDLEKELEWLNKVLPDVSRLNKIRIIQGLVRCSDGTWDYGSLKNGLMYIATDGAEGTVYHEAFHAVTQWILTDEELDALYAAARQKYGDLDPVVLEEKLANDFMLYTLGVNQQYKAKPLNIFQRLWQAIKSLFNSTSLIDKLYSDINNGIYAGKVLRNTSNEFSYISEEDIDNVAMDYNFVDRNMRKRLVDNGISKEQYDFLSDEEKRYLFHCVI